MPRTADPDTSRLSFRIPPDDKAVILRAATLVGTDLTDFTLTHTLAAAHTVIDQAEHLRLSGRDSLRVLDMLEHPPAPNARLLNAAGAMPKLS
jgi:uncharacterized protein (DUF1778 family)